MDVSLGHVCACGQPIVYYTDNPDGVSPLPVPGQMWILHRERATADIVVFDPMTDEMCLKRLVPECDWRSPVPGRWSWPPSTDVGSLFAVGSAVESGPPDPGD